MAMPTWFGRAALHPAVMSCCVLPVASATKAFVSSRQALPPPHPEQTNPLGQRARCKVLSAGGLIAEALLELDQGAGKIGHQGSREQLRVRDLF
jgi:hypothetical protein